MIFTWQHKDLVVPFRPYIFPLGILLDHDISNAGNHCPTEHGADCLYMSFLIEYTASKMAPNEPHTFVRSSHTD